MNNDLTDSNNSDILEDNIQSFPEIETTQFEANQQNNNSENPQESENSSESSESYIENDNIENDDNSIENTSEHPLAINTRSMLNSRPILGETNTCSICQTQMSLENRYIIADCKHCFHTDCIVSWYRTGRSDCPYCRTIPEEHELTTHSAFKFNRRYARRKEAPNELKTLVKKYKTIETQEKSASKAYRDWNKSPDGILCKNLLKTRHKLLEPINKKKFQLRKAKMDIAEYPIIPLVIPLRKYHNK